MLVPHFGVGHRFLRIAFGAAGVAAAHRYDLPLGLLGLLLIVSGIAGWCSVCETAAAAGRRFRFGRPEAGDSGGDPA